MLNCLAVNLTIATINSCFFKNVLLCVCFFVETGLLLIVLILVPPRGVLVYVVADAIELLSIADDAVVEAWLPPERRVDDADLLGDGRFVRSYNRRNGVFPLILESFFAR